ncbi:MAG: hypothetical protein ACLTXI_05825 [Collinsella sp.]
MDNRIGSFKRGAAAGGRSGGRYHGAVRVRVDRACEVWSYELAAGKDAGDDGCHACDGGGNNAHNGSVTRGCERASVSTCLMVAAAVVTLGFDSGFAWGVSTGTMTARLAMASLSDP